MSFVKVESAKGIQLVPLETQFFHDNKLFLIGQVNSETCNELIKQMMYLSKQDDIDEIVLFIDSPGGEVQAGLALFDVMRMVEKPVKTVVLGRAASMGAIIFLAGNKREMLSHSTIMIHDPAFGSRNIGGLKSHELKAELDDLNRCREILADIIAERTGKKLKEIYKVTAVDHYMNSKEALDFGLATKLYEKL